MDKLTEEQRRKNMQAVKSTGSKIEVALAKLLYSRGHRYRKNNTKVFGKPDITFVKLKIAIFVDGEFWHGKDWGIRKNDHKSNKDFWYKKIERNIERDKEVNEFLNRQGWIVLRFWGKDIKKNALSCVFKIEEEINNRKAVFNEKISITERSVEKYRIRIIEPDSLKGHYFNNEEHESVGKNSEFTKSHIMYDNQAEDEYLRVAEDDLQYSVSKVIESKCNNKEENQP